MLVASLAYKSSTYMALTSSGIVFNVLAIAGNGWTLTYPILSGSRWCSPTPDLFNSDWSVWDLECSLAIAAASGVGVLIIGQVFMIIAISLDASKGHSNHEQISSLRQSPPTFDVLPSSLLFDSV
eukprot:TRINITY_DN15674_c0_g1_i1.p1 TRINITY_DN15674_c0_g1~~TRINITY_DN15674_c0_g1_i1.p1  ORF type:complete len:134 (-),score=4.54 TRINITY_DN15674_c0_g1_i1:14-388(-)